MKETPRKPNTEIKVASAGPGVSFFLSGIFYTFFIISDFITFTFLSKILVISFGTLAFYNFILGLFNLIPAYPTDGGRLLRATLAKYMDYSKATSWASNIGKGIAISLAIFGILILNLWLILIAVFLFFGASQEEKSVKISLALEDKKVEDIMDKNVNSIPPNMSIRNFLDLIKKERKLVFPVVKEDKLEGIVLLDDVQKLESDKIDNFYVKDVMRKDFSKVSSDKKAIHAFKTLSKDKYDRVFVEKNNEIKGIITRNDIIHALKMSEI